MLWNPWHGCRKCSPGCINCYVYFLDGLRGKNAAEIAKNKTSFDLPIKRDRQGNYKIPSGTELGTCFTSDFFIEDADEWRGDVWKMIKQRDDVSFLIPTKRIHRFSECIPGDWGEGYPNVTIAVSCENQAKADERLPLLLDIKSARKIVFVAPILEYVDLSRYLASGGIDAVSVGGESYANSRECDFDWVKRIFSDCQRFNVGFDFHQTGSNFLKDGIRYRIKHRDEFSQAKKGEIYLRAGLSENNS